MQGSKDLDSLLLLAQTHQHGARSEAEQLGLESLPMRDLGNSGEGLSDDTTAPAPNVTRGG